MGILWEYSPWTFAIFNCLIAGGTAWMSGRGLALGWRPFWLLVAYMVLFSFAVRFLNFALFEGELLSVHHFLVAMVVVMIAAALGYRMTRTSQMVTQYGWLYRRTSPLTWTDR